MTDHDKKIIELHEKLEALDKKKDELEAKLSKKQSPFRNPAMVTALTGLVALLGTSVNNCHSRYLDRMEKVADKRVVDKTQGIITDTILDRLEDIEDQFMIYSAAIIEAMPRTQKRKVIRYLTENEIEHDYEVVEYSRAPSPTRSAPADYDEVGSAAVMLDEASAPEEVLVEAATAMNFYEAVQMQVQQREVNIEALEGFIEQRTRPRKR